MRTVSQRPDVMSGAPCIDGTRVSVQILAYEIERGGDVDHMVDYLGVTHEEIAHAVRWWSEHQAECSDCANGDGCAR